MTLNNLKKDLIIKQIEIYRKQNCTYLVDKGLRDNGLVPEMMVPFMMLFFKSYKRVFRVVVEEVDKPSQSRSQKRGIFRIIRLLIPARIRSLLWNSSTEWLLVNNLLSVFPSHRVRISVLKWLGADIAPSVAIYGGCEFRNPSHAANRQRQFHWP